MEREYVRVSGVNWTQPTYYQFVVDVATALTRSYDVGDDARSWAEGVRRHGHFSARDVMCVLVCASVWTAARWLMSKYVFERLGEISKLPVKERKKLPENIWNLMFATTAWGISAYLVLGKYDIFFEPTGIVYLWNSDEQVAWELRWAYLFQTSYYTHAVHTTLVLDEWKKDSAILLAHHFVSILLLSTSYVFRYLHVGLLVLFLHDFSDIFLSVSKLAISYKSKGGKWHQVCEVISAVGFVGFGVSWFVFRLHWFPLKLIYTTSHLTRVIFPDFIPPCFIFNNLLLITLLLMHVYWFKFILLMAYRLLSGKNKGINDVREYEKHQVKSTDKTE